MNYRVDLNLAVDAWLAARKNWLHVCSCNNPEHDRSSSLDRLNFATDVLYVAFAEGYTDIEKACADFYMFERFLMEQQNEKLPPKIRNRYSFGTSIQVGQA